jgi:SAM-dependent methyltransferase
MSVAHANRSPDPRAAVAINTVFTCPACRASLETVDTSYRCPACQQVYPVRDGIPVFAAEAGYWNNVDRATMEALLVEAESTGDWRDAMQRRMPRLVPAAAPAYRADAQFMFPIGAGSRVLDAGRMWGALSFPIAAHCGELYAVDKTWETLRLLDIRARQAGVTNVHPVLSSLGTLPFPDGFFDFVVLNGVLEWLATERDVVVDQHLEHGWDRPHRHTTDPRDVQLATLRELCRVTKPDGGLYVAIENRSGLQYFFGWPDDHVNIRFITFLPRWAANLATRLVRHTDYRTYVYTPAQLRKLLIDAGYRDVKLHAIHPYYGKISTLVPFEVFRRVRRMAFHSYPDIRLLMFAGIWRMTPPALTHWVAPSLGGIATRNGSKPIPRIVRMLSDAGVLSGVPSRYEALLVNWRFGDLHTINHVIYDKDAAKPLLFCKVSRSAKNDALDRESQALQYAAGRLVNSPLAKRIPQLVYYGRPDGIPLQVTEFLGAGAHREGIWGHLRRIDKIAGAHGLSPMLRRVQRFAGRRWLQGMEPRFRAAIGVLAEFQRCTTVRTFSIGVELPALLEARRRAIAENGLLSPAVASRLDDCAARMRDLAGEVPVCMVHGDFDLCNLLGEIPDITLVDFEHAEREGLPFFDLGNFVFSPLLTQWKGGGRTATLRDYAASSGWERAIAGWAREYAQRMAMPVELLEWLPVLAAIEQNAIAYPAWRDPATYPMFGEDALVQMLDWRLALR